MFGRPESFAALGLTLVVAAASAAAAHDDPNHRFAELTAQIAQRPDDAGLYLERAELHRLGRDWSDGIADLQAASRIDPSLAGVDLALANLLLDADNLAPALEAADRHLARQPDDAGGHRTRARILFRSGAGLDAAAEFTRAIDLHAASAGEGAIAPDDYLARAKALADAGRIDESLRGLDEGLVALGQPIVLQLFAIELEETRGHPEQALARVAALEARARRKEQWMVRRGDLLVRLGRNDDAARAYRDARRAIAALPPGLRRNTATSDLDAQLRRRLEDLDSTAGRGSAVAATSVASSVLAASVVAPSVVAPSVAAAMTVAPGANPNSATHPAKEIRRDR